MGMPEGWKRLRLNFNETELRKQLLFKNRPTLDAHNVIQILDLLKEMAEALEAYEAKKYFGQSGELIMAPKEMGIALKKFKEWK